MNLLFLHGWNSTPGGIKPTYLKDHGHTVFNPKLPDDDFDEAVRIAQAEFDPTVQRDNILAGNPQEVELNVRPAISPLCSTFVAGCSDWTEKEAGMESGNPAKNRN